MIVTFVFLVMLAAADGAPPPTTGHFFYSALEISGGFDPPFLYLPLHMGSSSSQIVTEPNYKITNIDKTDLKSNDLENNHLQTISTQELRLTVNHYPTVMMTTDCGSSCKSVVTGLDTYNSAESKAFDVTKQGVVFAQDAVSVTANAFTDAEVLAFPEFDRITVLDALILSVQSAVDASGTGTQLNLYMNGYVGLLPYSDPTWQKAGREGYSFLKAL